jgi:hypothetical protein
VPVCCSHCGKELLRENARFCCQCGLAFSPFSSSSQQESLDIASSLLEKTDKRPHVLREQIAQQTFTHSRSQPVSKQTIPMVSQASVPIAAIPVSEVLDEHKTSPPHEAEIDVLLQKTQLSIFVVRESTPRPKMLPLSLLPGIEKHRREMGEVLARAGASDRSSTAQLAEKRRSRRVPLPPTNNIRRLSWFEIICILSVFLLLSSGLIWFLYTSSTNDAITNPVQNFTDTHQGIALQYPNQWIETSDSAQSTISFYDNSNHTTQIKIGMYEEDIDIEQFMQKQSLQFGIRKSYFGAYMSFAGARWKQLQGYLVEKGADYVGVIFATQHNRHLYMIAQFAPQKVYATEEKLIFMPLRMSLKFL